MKIQTFINTVINILIHPSIYGSYPVSVLNVDELPGRGLARGELGVLVIAVHDQFVLALASKVSQSMKKEGRIV